MSGLINAHTHIGSDRVANRNFPQTETTVTYNALHNLKEGLQGGVTYIRSCGVPFDVDIKLKKNPRPIAVLKAQGLRPAGMPVSILGGHADLPVGENNEQNAAHLVNSPDDMRKAIREQFKKGCRKILS